MQNKLKSHPKGEKSKKEKRRTIMCQESMKRGRNFSGNVKDGKSHKKIYQNVPHLTLKLHYKPRKSYCILESSVVNLSNYNKGKPMAKSTNYIITYS